jgi:creatinine amidohydrolase
MNKKQRWVDFTSDELARGTTQSTVAILPLAAVEQHGPHLPLGVDLFLVESFLEASLKLTEAKDQIIVLPTLQLGLSPEHEDFVGTISLNAELAIGMCQKLAQAAAHAGVSKLLLFNSHGGNVGLMDIVGREIRRKTGLLVFHSSWYELAQHELMTELFGHHELRFGVHAGAVETSLMMAIRPDLVDVNQLEDHPSAAQFKSTHYPILGDGRSAKQSWMTKDYSPSGAVGNATLASADKGKKLIDHVGQRLLELTREIAQFQA